MFKSLEVLREGLGKQRKKLKDKERWSKIWSAEKMYIWGTGQLGCFALSQCKKNNRNVVSFIDNNLSVKGKLLHGIKIVSPADIETDYPILVCSRAFVDIGDFINCNLENQWIYYEELAALDDSWEEWYGHEQYHEMFYKLDCHFKNYIQLFEKCEDEVSKEVLDCILNYRTTFEREWLEKAYIKSTIKGEKVYFDKSIIKLTPGEVYVDCGAYVGDTALEFIKNVGGYKKIYVLEPCEKIFNQARINLQAWDKIEFVHAGVGKETTRVRFSGGGFDGHVDKYGEEKVQIVCLDEVIKVPPTLIKMDIEGAEIDALQGAKTIITQYRPKLAICVYHKAEDLFAILELIDSWNLNYAYYFRHYKKGISDTVLYCIPR